MSNIVDNIIAFRILYLLVTPFEKTPAFKTGVIDKQGKVLVKIKDQTPEQKASYDMLDRLVFSLKRLLAKIPGGSSQIATLAAAYYLVKESYESKMTSVNESRFNEVMNLTNMGIIFIEETILIEKFIREDGMALGAATGTASPIPNITGSGVSTDIPLTKLGGKKVMFRRKKPVELRSK